MKLRNILIALTALTFPALGQQAGLTKETWNNLPAGKSILILEKQGISARAADSTSVVSQAQTSGLPALSGTRLRGTLTPLVTDTYTFWVNGNSNVALWISEDGTRFTKQRIAWNTESTTTSEWNKHPAQRSVPISLEAGISYHIEAHVMSGAANGHLAIAWQGQKGNWALASNGSTATQSGTNRVTSPASLAIDGNTNGLSAYCSMTTNQQNSWLKVDFGTTRPVNQINLFNNTQYLNWISNFRISLLDASGNTLVSQDFFTTSGNAGNFMSWDLPSVYQAAAVKIQLLGNNLANNGVLSLAEVQAFHNPPPATNWALASNGASAAQTTTSGSANAALAIDGNTNGNFDTGSVTLTQDQTNSALEINLGQDRPVNRVVLHNRNTLQTRLSNFRMSLLDGSNQVIASEDFFTANGHAGTVHYWNLASTFQARSIRVELLGNNLDGNGFLSLAEVQAFEIDLLRESRDFQVIPSAYLRSVGVDLADLNDNDLPDTWEASTGLTTSQLPGALLKYGDPDKDGITNYEEQLYGGDPLLFEELGNGLTRSVWTEINNTGIAGMVGNRARYLSYPNLMEHAPGVDHSEGRVYFGQRFRGSFIAPASGAYRFWISGRSDAQLWIADGSVKHPTTQDLLTDRFGKRLIASSGGTTPLRDFDFTAQQRSRLVYLDEGETYYIEVLQKFEFGGGDHVSVAWQVPGQARAIMPATAFIANAPDPLDLDDDNLPDAWETSKTLSPTDNGLTNAANGEYGDPDSDKLTNLQEFQYGTNPKAADTDGDGLTDFDEIFHYGTNPLVSNSLNPITLSLPQLNQYTTATGGWTTNTDGSLSAWDRRGGITYTFTVTQPGIHEVSVSAAAISNQPSITKTLNLNLSLGSATPFAKGSITSANGTSGTLRAVTPWLAAGTHTLTIYHDNVLAELRMRLTGVSVKRLGGQDLNEDGVPDWIAENEAQANKLTRIATSSRTSPLSIEGITRQVSSVVLSSNITAAIPANASINNSFFADVPLSETGDVTLNASYLSGLVTESHDISWISTNLFEFDQAELHIRAGDSLRLDAWSGEEADTGTFTVTSNGVLLADSEQSTNHTSGESFVATFASAGTYTLVATHDGQTSTVTLKVHSANFGPAYPVRTGLIRSWTPTSLGAIAVVENDDQIVLAETTTSGARKFNAGTLQPANLHTIARLPENIEGAASAILARGTIQGFDVAQVDQTRDAQVIHRYDDGTWLSHSTIVAKNLPPGVVIRLTLNNQGVLFTNGSNVMEITAADLDVNGIANIYYEYVGEVAPKICHNAQILIQP